MTPPSLGLSVSNALACGAGRMGFHPSPRAVARKRERLQGSKGGSGSAFHPAWRVCWLLAGRVLHSAASSTSRARAAFIKTHAMSTIGSKPTPHEALTRLTVDQVPQLGFQVSSRSSRHRWTTSEA